MASNAIIHNDNFFVFTGGPGTGKTTLLYEMKKRNFHCVDEVARKIIKKQADINADSPEWRKSDHFRELTLRHCVDDYVFANSNVTGITFFDRSIIDSCYFPEKADTPLERECGNAANKYRYNKKVFIFPPWKEIYRNDKERIQTFDEALGVYQKVINIYSEYGYDLFEVPKMDDEDRVEFIIANVQ